MLVRSLADSLQKGASLLDLFDRRETDRSHMDPGHRTRSYWRNVVRQIWREQMQMNCVVREIFHDHARSHRPHRTHSSELYRKYSPCMPWNAHATRDLATFSYLVPSKNITYYLLQNAFGQYPSKPSRYQGLELSTNYWEVF